MTDNAKPESRLTMSLLELAHLGDGEVAYIRQLDHKAAKALFPGLRGVPLDVELFAVLGADGTPIAIADSHDSAIANAIENDLEPVSVH